MSNFIKTHQACPNCKSSDALGIAQDHEHCFSCGHHLKTSHNSLQTPSRGSALNLASWEGKLPYDFVPNVFTDDHKEYLSQFESPFINCGSSKYYNRIIFPVYYLCTLKCFQGKSLTDDIKWITMSHKYKWGNKFPYISHSHSNRWVIVEDMISAMVVSQVVPTIALLGSSVNKDLINFLLSFGNDFIIWLDNDEAGRNGTKKLLKELALCATLEIVNTKFDPKYYSVNRVREILCNKEKNT